MFNVYLESTQYLLSFQTQTKLHMKIHEYQARQLFRKYGIPVPEDVLCYTVSEVEKAARDLNRMVVVKAQVLVGGVVKQVALNLHEMLKTLYLPPN